jgi:membrane associated rhomboid family serine protease
MNISLGVTAIIILNIIFTFFAFSNERFMDRYVFRVGSVLREKEWDRIIMSSFLHVDIMHLFFNMFSFYSFGGEIEREFGLLVLLPVYFGGMIAGDLLALFINRRNPNYQAVGASGAVSAIIFASILFFPGGSLYIIPIPIPIPSFLFGFIFIAISIWGIGRMNQRIGHEAHLGGAAWGVFSSVLISPSVLVLYPFISAVVILPLIGFAWILYKKPEWLRPR